MGDAGHIVFDVGGTKMRVATAEDETLGEVKKVPTPQDMTETIQTLARIARRIGENRIRCAAGCIPAQTDLERGVYDANNRPAWNGRHFDTELSTALGVPVKVANDCAVIGLGEYRRGAGKGARAMAYVTVSTGVGAARIVDGAIAPLEDFFLGHELIDGEELEDLVSGTAVKKKFGIEPKDLESLEERNKLADILAEGLSILIETWSPDTIVLGGSMIVGVNPIPLERVQSELAKRLSQPIAVKMAELGDNGGLVGAAILAQKILPAG
ncbi:hypothetical protein A3A38_04145 [Candidatus Kaiserbacteria bacterium RIFCSPLOWO2_01_FULL_53_17]|uniref:ROK family protein n=1 Tax=Candidatus Kaiserbacteria bacterium RIFCSPLOWO2_01_FULL_53_17 TaxID=1798511 RepID=A0A1F6EFT7_9BACT|nr:MAG: hypothetical protein A3A38_04145 [Candidatus Kaiserbacteria bacterium RIFCSPLOWO2_01_FULL_53_17]